MGKHFRYWQDYVRATLRGTGGAMTTIVNMMSLVFGLALVAIILYSFQLNAPSVALAFFAFLALLIITHYSSFLLYQAQRDKSLSLENQLTPAVVLTPKTLKGLEIGGVKTERGSLAYLEVANSRGGQLEAVSVKAQITEHGEASGRGDRNYRHRRFPHVDLYLKWQATDERTQSFHHSANVEVAYGECGTGWFLLRTHGDSTPRRLMLHRNYELQVIAAADGHQALTQRFLLRMNEAGTWRDGDKVYFVPGVPYSIEFRPWLPSDNVSDELDLDAWRAEHNAA